MYGEKIKQLLKTRGLKQTDIARDIGIPQTTISYYIQSAYPPLDAIEKICAYLGMEVWEFFVDAKDIEGALGIPPEFIEFARLIYQLSPRQRSKFFEACHAVLSAIMTDKN